MVGLLFVGSLIGDAASAVIPHLRRCTALPRNPRSDHSFKHTAFPFRTRCASKKGSHKV